MCRRHWDHRQTHRDPHYLVRKRELPSTISWLGVAILSQKIVACIPFKRPTMPFSTYLGVLYTFKSAYQTKLLPDSIGSWAVSWVKRNYCLTPIHRQLHVLNTRWCRCFLLLVKGWERKGVTAWGESALMCCSALHTMKRLYATHGHLSHAITPVNDNIVYFRSGRPLLVSPNLLNPGCEDSPRKSRGGPLTVFDAPPLEFRVWIVTPWNLYRNLGGQGLSSANKKR